MATRGGSRLMDHERDAKVLADRLMKNIIEGRRDYLPEPLEIYVADVEAGVDRFEAQLGFSLRFDSGFPCITGSELVPVDWFGLVGSLGTKLWYELSPPQRQAWLKELWNTVAPVGPFLKMQPVRPLDALSLFREGLIQFLAVRFSARQSNIASSPGLQFRVITQTHGLRVHWSPAYFYNPNNVFGSPTSPVDGWIQPGRYMFGAFGPSFPLRFDPATFDIPPLTQASLVGI